MWLLSVVELLYTEFYMGYSVGDKVHNLNIIMENAN
jgi:hypothetical protein